MNMHIDKSAYIRAPFDSTKKFLPLILSSKSSDLFYPFSILSSLYSPSSIIFKISLTFSFYIESSLIFYHYPLLLFFFLTCTKFLSIILFSPNNFIKFHSSQKYRSYRNYYGKVVYTINIRNKRIGYRIQIHCISRNENKERSCQVERSIIRQRWSVLKVNKPFRADKCSTKSTSATRGGTITSANVAQLWSTCVQVALY